MMGAMPAVAVRLERRKAEKKLKRPSQLYIGGYPNVRQTSPPSKHESQSPSPLLSPPRGPEEDNLPEIYVCGKISGLHLAVISLLLGAVILIVGLVQLKPGADTQGHRYYLIGIGCLFEVLGLVITAVRCCLLHWKMEKRRQKFRREGNRIVVNVNGPGGERLETDQDDNIEKCDPQTSEDELNKHHVNLKHLYNSTDVMYIDESDTGRNSKSPTVESVSTIEVLMGTKPPDKLDPDACSLGTVIIPSPSEFDSLLHKTNNSEKQPN